MAGSLRKSLVGKEDCAVHTTTGYPSTFERLSSVGDTLTLTKLPDIWETHQVVVNARAHNNGLFNEATILAAISYMNGTNLPLYLEPGDWLINNDLTIPSNAHLIIPKGAKLIKNATGVTVTINGYFNPGLYQVFKDFDAGDITLALIKEAYPEWWTENTTPGTTNMTIANQSAINSLSSGVVALTNGIYLSDAISLKDNVYLYIAGGATLKQKGTGAARLIHIEDVSNTGVFGEGAIDGNSALSGLFNAHCIRIKATTKDVDNIFVKGVTIKNASAEATASGDCININGTSDSSFIPKNIRVSNTYCYNPDRNGITVITGKNITIANNIIVDYSQTGIDLEHGASQTIENVSITGNIIERINSGQKGIDLTGDFILCDSNIIRNVSIHGIQCGGSSFNYSVISNNIIETGSDGNNGIHLDKGAYILIDGNFIKSRYHGIDIELDANHIKMTNNFMRCGSYGINFTVDGAGYCFIEGNTLERTGTPDVAIDLKNTPYNIVGINQFIDYVDRVKNIASTSFIASRGDSPIIHINSKAVADHNTTLTEREAGLILVDTSDGAFTLILPNCPYACLGISYTFKKKDSSANAFTIDGNGNDRIDGELTNSEIDAQHDTITVTSDTGATWRITQRWIH